MLVFGPYTRIKDEPHALGRPQLLPGFGRAEGVRSRGVVVQ